MSPLLRNILAVVAGILVGGALNAFLVNISGTVIPHPEGVDVSNVETMKSTMHLFQTKHYLMPFLAHALGTLVGAMVAIAIGVSHQRRLAMIIAFFFLLGGIAAVAMLPGPLWFEIVDLVFAYIPMGILAYLPFRKKLSRQ